ncbi:MAG: phage tail tube protein [Porcipelethomonas sp.]
MPNINGSVNASELALNYDYELSIATFSTSTGSPGINRNYQVLAAGFDNIAESLNEVLYQSGFLSDKGWGSSFVTGGQLIITLSGVRVVGDPAQDYIFSSDVMYGFGKARETDLRLTLSDSNLKHSNVPAGAPDGSSVSGYIIEAPCTLAKITKSGGAANQPTAISVEIHINGEPTCIPVTSE